MSVQILPPGHQGRAASRHPGEVQERLSQPTRLRLRTAGGELVELSLEVDCAGCGSAGYVPVVVEVDCTSCGGSGFEDEFRQQVCGVCDGVRVRQVEEWEQCERCDGTGFELTAPGRQLLACCGLQLRAFLARWLPGWRLG